MSLVASAIDVLLEGPHVFGERQRLTLPKTCLRDYTSFVEAISVALEGDPTKGKEFFPPTTAFSWRMRNGVFERLTDLNVVAAADRCFLRVESLTGGSAVGVGGARATPPPAPNPVSESTVEVLAHLYATTVYLLTKVDSVPDAELFPKYSLDEIAQLRPVLTEAPTVDDAVARTLEQAIRAGVAKRKGTQTPFDRAQSAEERANAAEARAHEVEAQLDAIKAEVPNYSDIESIRATPVPTTPPHSRPTSAKTRPPQEGEFTPNSMPRSRPASAKVRAPPDESSTAKPYLVYEEVTKPDPVRNPFAAPSLESQFTSGLHGNSPQRGHERALDASLHMLDEADMRHLFQTMKGFDGTHIPRASLKELMDNNYESYGDDLFFERTISKVVGKQRVLTYDEFSIVLLKLAAS